jgi:hypothetical protein
MRPVVHETLRHFLLGIAGGADHAEDERDDRDDRERQGALSQAALAL